MDILFDGIPIDCSSDEFQAKAVCSVFESGEVKAVRPISSTHYAFSLLAQGNATDLGEFKVFRGKKQIEFIKLQIKYIQYGGQYSYTAPPQMLRIAISANYLFLTNFSNFR